MEALGVPAAVLITRPFFSSAKAMALSHGIADYRFVLFPHPIGPTDRETLEEWADEACDRVVSVLLGT